MWASLLAQYGLPALVWAKDHWRDVGCGLALVLAVLLFRAQGELSACHAALANPPKVEVSQVQNVESKGNAQVRVIYRPVPCPQVSVDGKACPPCVCPELDVQASADYEAAIKQAQEMSNLASTCQSQPKNGIFIGAGYFGMPIAQVDLMAGNWKANAIAGFQDSGTVYGGTVSRKLFEW